MSRRTTRGGARGSHLGQVTAAGDVGDARSPYAITGLGREMLEAYLASASEPPDPEEPEVAGP